MSEYINTAGVAKIIGTYPKTICTWRINNDFPLPTIIINDGVEGVKKISIWKRKEIEKFTEKNICNGHLKKRVIL